MMPELLFSESHQTDRKFFLYGFICTPLIFWGDCGNNLNVLSSRIFIRLIFVRYFISVVCPFIRSFSEAKFTFQGFFLVSLQFRALTVHDKTEHRYVTSSATNNHTYTNTLNDNTWTRKYVVKET